MKVEVNPAVISWARKSLNLSVADVSRKMNKPEALVQAWESGTEQLTYAQLEQLAYQVFKRPLAVFFFPVPPKDPDISKSFRTLPGKYLELASSAFVKQLRIASANLINLYELFGSNDKISSFNDLKAKIYGKTAPETYQLVREHLGVELDAQIGWKNEDEALKQWRTRLESLGAFVFKDAFRDEAISGFCVYDENFPTIYVNNSKSKTRQIFTIVHEFAHLIFQTSGIDFAEEVSFSDFLEENARIERACNVFASHVLIPDNVLLHYTQGTNLKSSIENLARLLKVSRDAIAVRLIQGNRLTSEEWEVWSREWAQNGAPKKSDSGNYYNSIGVYLSERYATEVYKRYFQGSLSLTQAADFLNVKEKTFQNLEHKFVS